MHRVFADRKETPTAINPEIIEEKTVKRHEEIRMKKTFLLSAVIICLCGTLLGCGDHPEKADTAEAPTIQNHISDTDEDAPAETVPDTENETSAENANKISAEDAADTFGIPIVLPKNSNWIEDAEYDLADENNLKITYHDLIADADCTLLVSKNGDPDLPPAEYDEALNETWEGSTVGGQHITVNVQHEKGNEKMTLAVWEYKEYRFALMGEDDSNAAIPKTALCVIENLD